jgi:SulP family sulfate permease
LPAFGVTFVAFSDNVLTARAFAVRRGEVISANQELIALAAANTASGLVAGFPVSSSGSRTAVAAASGAVSQVCSVVAAGVVVVVAVLGRSALATFPTAALGAIVTFAAIQLVDVAAFRSLARFRRSELLLALVTTSAVVVVDVLYGVLAAVALSIVDLVRRVARPHDGILGYVPGVAGMHDVDDYPNARLVPGLVVYRYDSPLFFANAEDFKRRALASLGRADGPVEWFLLNAEANVEIDSTALDALEELRSELERRGVVFAMARVKQDLRVLLVASGFLGRVGEDQVFMTLPTAVQAYASWYRDRHGTSLPGFERRDEV